MLLQRHWFVASIIFVVTAGIAGCASTPESIDDWQAPASAPEGSPVAAHGQLKVVGTQLQDQAGTPVQLKGVSSMWLNYASDGYAESKPGLEYMRDNWKLSVIRAAMGTDEGGGYLTSPSAKTTMQTKVERIVQHAIDLGVYVIVDWHTYRAQKNQAGAVQFFTYMAHKYGQFPNVIWEDYNEPANEQVNGTNHNYTWAEIKPYHEALVAAIRAEDADNIIVLGTPIWSQSVDEAAKDPVAGTNLMYTLHFYSCTHKQWLRDKADTAIAAGLALFVTEFGATFADGGVPSANHYAVCRAETDLWFDWMAKNNISGASWKLDKCNDASCILGPKAELNGPWGDDVLSTDVGGAEVTGGTAGAHGVYVVSWIRK